MTTTTVHGIAGPFTDVVGNRLEPNTEFELIDKVRKTPLILPAGNEVVEIIMRRRADLGDATMDLTPGRGIAVGYTGNPRVFTGTPGIITDELNVFDANSSVPYRHFVRLDPSTTFNRVSEVEQSDQTFVLQSAFGGNVTDGGVSVIIKYKPFPESVAERIP
jgi:hypothetical protein